MMNAINVAIETGKKKVFASSINWPGWSRSAGDENAALQTLVDYGSRYAGIFRDQQLKFRVPTGTHELTVTEQHTGNATTDFGAPVIVLDADRASFNQVELERSRIILQACWLAFDAAVNQAAGQELRKGPRGGGRDLEKIIEHVLDADRSYLPRLAYKFKKDPGIDRRARLDQTRQAVLDAIEIAANGDLPERGPRGGARLRRRNTGGDNPRRPGVGPAGPAMASRRTDPRVRTDRCASVNPRIRTCVDPLRPSGAVRGAQP